MTPVNTVQDILYVNMLNMTKFKLLTILASAVFLAGCTTTAKPTTFEQPPLENQGISQTTPEPSQPAEPTASVTATLTPSANTTAPSVNQLLNLKPNQKMYATIKTNLGDIKIELYPDKAPQTVANFVGLSEGTLAWTDPKTGTSVKKPLYNGTIFHRVIKGFMIQGGDPLGTGMGGPGYKFNDEFNDSLQFNSAGILAMANSGPNTNGSQFFITHAATPWLNGKHTIFGMVASGMDVVDKIANVKTDEGDRPVDPVTIQQIVITRTDASAQ